MAQNTVLKGREKLCAPKLENYSRLELVRVRVRKRRTKEKSPEIGGASYERLQLTFKSVFTGFQEDYKSEAY